MKMNTYRNVQTSYPSETPTRSCSRNLRRTFPETRGTFFFEFNTHATKNRKTFNDYSRRVYMIIFHNFLKLKLTTNFIKIFMKKQKKKHPEEKKQK